MSKIVALTLCLLVSSAFGRTVVDFTPLLAHQQQAFHHLMSSQAAAVPGAGADPILVNKCFNKYLEEQTGVVTSYNTQYNGCVNTAQSARDELTAQNFGDRNDLVSRQTSMCDDLSFCDRYTDGLEFFDCFSTASANSYKVMFTLNSDANAEYNYINARYSVIENDENVCIEDARVDYAKKMDTANENLQACLNGDDVTGVPTGTPTPIPSDPTGTPTPTSSDPTGTPTPTTSNPTGTPTPTTINPTDTTLTPTSVSPTDTTLTPTTIQPTDTTEDSTPTPTTIQPTDTTEDTTPTPTTIKPTDTTPDTTTTDFTTVSPTDTTTTEYTTVSATDTTTDSTTVSPTDTTTAESTTVSPTDTTTTDSTTVGTTDTTTGTPTTPTTLRPTDTTTETPTSLRPIETTTESQTTIETTTTEEKLPEEDLEGSLLLSRMAKWNFLRRF